MELGRLLGQQADLVDRERLDPVVLPVVGVPSKARLRQKGGRQQSRDGGLAQARLPDEEVGMSQAAALELRPQLFQRLWLTGDAREWVSHGVWGGAARRAFVSRSMARRCARPWSHTSRMRWSAVRLVSTASRKTTAYR